jgi:hypothetical protein
MAKRGSRRAPKGSKTGRQAGGAQAANTLVPFNVLTNLTDGMKFPVLNERVFTCVQSNEVDAWLVSQAVGDTANVLTVTLTQLMGGSGNLSAFQGIFDQYRIEVVEAWLVPNQNAIASATTYASSPNLGTVIDYDDPAPVSTFLGLTGYANFIRTEPYEKQRRCFKPRIAYAAYSGAFTSYANQAAGWIDMASPTVQHYGVKVACTPDGNTSGPHAAWDLYYKAHVSFRAVR